MDGDAVFARFDRPVLSTLLHLSHGKDALLSTEFTVPLNVTEKQLDTQQARVDLNSGVMLMRSTAWSRSFLDRVYHDAPYTSHWGAIFGYFDQAAITHFQRTHAKEWVQHVRVAHFRHWNGGKRVLGKSMIYHAAGGQGVADKYDKVLNMCLVLTCKHVPQKCWRGSIFKGKGRDYHSRERSGLQGTAGA
ncbi:hypothetical protein DUNSADRAFT_18691 [Dunaliella salina]|nr:hypothetical protein DUNSADRAFT_18691 [Dunaliella salina]|eukprot:KAF5827821.1 hypothetical protein DUNSADRAFT_18691 [Dunaliella salina]